MGYRVRTLPRSWRPLPAHVAGPERTRSRPASSAHWPGVPSVACPAHWPAARNRAPASGNAPPRSRFTPRVARPKRPGCPRHSASIGPDSPRRSRSRSRLPGLWSSGGTLRVGARPPSPPSPHVQLAVGELQGFIFAGRPNAKGDRIRVTAADVGRPSSCCHARYRLLGRRDSVDSSDGHPVNELGCREPSPTLA